MTNRPSILHIMLSKDFGGIESAFLRYADALHQLDYTTINVTSANSSVVAKLSADSVVESFDNASEWDPVAIYRAYALIKKYKPSLLIVHGNRAARLFRRAKPKSLPIICILHRHKFSDIHLYSRLITVSESLRQAAINHGYPPEQVTHIPNFISHAVTAKPRPHNDIPIIGFLGRFAPEKGADLLVEALGMLQARHIPFKAVFGGNGPQQANIEALIQRHGLQNHITLLGWVDQVEDFYRTLDLLVVPSRSESFGLIILEAWQYGVPVIATKTSGPCELIRHGENGLLVDISAEALADAMSSMLSNSQMQATLSSNSTAALQPYTMESILPALREVIEGTLAKA